MKLSLPIYDPPVVEVGGKEYPLRPINRATFRKLREIDKKSEGSTDPYDEIESGYEVILTCVDAPAEVVDSLPIGQVKEISKFIRRVITGAKEEEEGGTGAGPDPAKVLTPEEKAEVEKNAPKPGDGPAAS